MGCTVPEYNRTPRRNILVNVFRKKKYHLYITSTLQQEKRQPKELPDTKLSLWLDACRGSRLLMECTGNVF